VIVGLWDDVMGMRPRNKFVAQIVVAVISMIYGFHHRGLRISPFGHRLHQHPAVLGYAAHAGLVPRA
jgi:UDP-N-acetylmuramyl pentapeptide phosphotransferase/UDP-N-acetylglucosamine-1-phosphate transferase